VLASAYVMVRTSAIAGVDRGSGETDRRSPARRPDGVTPCDERRCSRAQVPAVRGGSRARASGTLAWT
jgi:hypothetical protein